MIVCAIPAWPRPLFDSGPSGSATGLRRNWSRVPSVASGSSGVCWETTVVRNGPWLTAVRSKRALQETAVAAVKSVIMVGRNRCSPQLNAEHSPSTQRPVPEGVTGAIFSCGFGSVEALQFTAAAVDIQAPELVRLPRE